MTRYVSSAWSFAVKANRIPNKHSSDNQFFFMMAPFGFEANEQ
jgi:hypothetical protein